LAELLDRYVPTGIDVYVKEHPNHPGALNTKAVRRIASLKSTQLIPPSTNSHKLIRNANGVAVINSTAGMESLLYHKPVVTFGKSVYRGQGVTIDVTDPYEIPEKLARMEEQGWIETHEFVERDELLELAEPVKQAYAEEPGAAEVLEAVNQTQ
jgi:capsule polysaccharide export protein KpsC/LpsZ